MTHNGKDKFMVLDRNLKPLKVKILGNADADGSVVTCVAKQIVSGIVKEYKTSVNISVLCM